MSSMKSLRDSTTICSRKTLHFGLDQIIGAAVDHARHGEVHGPEQSRRAAGKYDRIEDGDAKRRSIEYAEKTLVGTHAALRYSSSRKL